jgi:hypothetical protein
MRFIGMFEIVRAANIFYQGKPAKKLLMRISLSVEIVSRLIIEDDKGLCGK